MSDAIRANDATTAVFGVDGAPVPELPRPAGRRSALLPVLRRAPRRGTPGVPRRPDRGRARRSCRPATPVASAPGAAVEVWNPAPRRLRDAAGGLPERRRRLAGPAAARARAARLGARERRADRPRRDPARHAPDRAARRPLGHRPAGGGAEVRRRSASSAPARRGAAAAAGAADAATTSSGGASGSSGSARREDRTRRPPRAPRPAGAASRQELSSLKGKDSTKAVDKLAKKGKPISTGGGKLPPTDNKPAGGGSSFETIG